MKEIITSEIVERARLAGAMANVDDARCDLMIWPDLRRQIMADLLRAIEAHEKARTAMRI